MRAHAVTTFTCTTHLLFAAEYKRDPNKALSDVLKPYFSEKQQKSKSFGYATDALLAQMKTASGVHDMKAAVEPVQEMAILELEHDTAEMRNLSQPATEYEIAYVLNTTKFFHSKTTAERGRLIQDTDGTLSKMITEAVCTTLGTIVPGIDLDKSLNISRDSNKIHQPPITDSEKKSLQTLLKSQVCWIQFDASKQKVPGGQYRQDILQPVIDVGDFTSSDGFDERISSNSSVNLEKLSKVRARLGENLPPNQDLTAICNLRGIDVNALSVNLYNPLLKARAPQITGMSFFSIIA